MKLPLRGRCIYSIFSSATSKQDSLNLEEMLRQNQTLFAGGSISEEAKDQYFQAVMEAYLDCKKAAKETFGRKKSENLASIDK